MAIVPPSPEQLREIQLHEANLLSKKLEGEAEKGIPFSTLDIDDVVTVVNRERPSEWYRFRIVTINHGQDTSKPGDPEVWAICGPISNHWGSMYPDDIYKVVAKRGRA